MLCNPESNTQTDRSLESVLLNDSVELILKALGVLESFLFNNLVEINLVN